jgi:murein DD-endopeptidase MepM/ murein hydrolase activator NlpD
MNAYHNSGKPFIFFSLFCMMWQLTACAGAVSTTPTVTSTPTSQPSFTTSPSQDVTGAPTIDVTQTTVPSATTTPKPTLPPLRFTFPSPGPAPVSSWRPPLYDVPWALSPNDHFYFRRPIAADTVNWPLADYRYGGIFPGTEIVHSGVDIDAPKGTPVLAAAAGQVIWAGWGLFYGNDSQDDPYGQAVAIRHDFGYNGQRLYTIYAHMEEVDVSVGQRVDPGSQLGLVGETGKVTGPHLHFEVRLGQNNFFSTRNPELWLSPPIGWGVLVGRLTQGNNLPLSNQEVTVLSVSTLQAWTVRSYGPAVATGDDYYHENLALSDLPAGKYEVWIDYQGQRYKQMITIHPGAVTYFSFTTDGKFKLEIPTSSALTSFLSTPTPTKKSP